VSFLTAVITNNISRKTVHHDLERHDGVHIVHLWKQRHKSKFVIFQEKLLKVLKCCTFYECNDNTTALQRRVLQTALWHCTC